MSALLERIRAHAAPELLRRIEVPEWSLDGTRPLVIMYSMVTLDDLVTINEAAQSQDFSRSAPYVITTKARDEKGNPLFKIIDAVELRRSAAPEVVKRVAMQMLGRVTIEDAEKN